MIDPNNDSNQQYTGGGSYGVTNADPHGGWYGNTGGTSDSDSDFEDDQEASEQVGGSGNSWEEPDDTNYSGSPWGTTPEGPSDQDSNDPDPENGSDPADQADDAIEDNTNEQYEDINGEIEGGQSAPTTDNDPPGTNSGDNGGPSDGDTADSDNTGDVDVPDSAHGGADQSPFWSNAGSNNTGFSNNIENNPLGVGSSGDTSPWIDYSNPGAGYQDSNESGVGPGTGGTDGNQNNNAENEDGMNEDGANAQIPTWMLAGMGPWGGQSNQDNDPQNGFMGMDTSTVAIGAIAFGVLAIFGVVILL